jgi:anionic cell wall polymer biosynthesis LytR-Cps2A-Psr (LCP) family protein
MADIIDAVGGIEIEVRQAEINANNGLNHNIREQAAIIGIDPSKHLVTKAGVQKLSGIQAVAWARIRSVATLDGVGNDYGRTDRQRLVMEKLLDKALAMKPTEYPGFIKKILPYMRTSVSPGYAASLATTVLTKKVNFEQARLPHNKIIITDNAITTAGSSVYFDPEDAKAIIHAFIYDDISPDEFLKTYVPKKNNWANISLGGSGGGALEPTDPIDPLDPNTSSDPSSSENPSSDSSDTTSSGEQGDAPDGGDNPPSDGDGSEDTSTQSQPTE